MATLTDRYVLTVLRRVPDAQRGDLERELRATIDDLVEARRDAGATDDEAVRGALTELGDPDRFATQALGRPQVLLGPDVYPTWRRLLITLASTIAPIAAVVHGTIIAFTGGDVGAVIGGAVVTALTVLLHLVFWTTLVFAVIDRAGAAASLERGAWTPDRLPDYEDARPKAPELAVQLALLVLFAVAAVWQHVASPVEVDGATVPLFGADGWAAWWPLLALVFVGEAAFAVWTWRRGWTPVAAVVNVVLNLALVVPSVWFAAQGTLYDARFFEALGWTSGDADVVQVTTMATAALLVAGGVWDAIDGVRRTIRAQRGERTQVSGTGAIA